MAIVDRLFLATLTKNEDDAGTGGGGLNLTINVDGVDVVDINFSFMGGSGLLDEGLGPDNAWLSEGQAALSGGDIFNPGEILSSPIESNLLTNSSIRLGTMSDDAWGPRHVLVLGRTERRVIALAMETELERWLSTDKSEGKLTMPIRLVGEGSSSTLIRRVILIVYTVSDNTDSPIQLQITAGGNLVLSQQIPDTEQDDFEDYTGNWYFLDAAVPFTRGDVLSSGGIRLSILGTDSWTPERLFVYGLDTADGRPNEVVHLVSIPEWDLPSLSADPQEGEQSIDLPVI